MKQQIVELNLNHANIEEIQNSSSISYLFNH